MAKKRKRLPRGRRWEKKVLGFAGTMSEEEFREYLRFRVCLEQVIGIVNCGVGWGNGPGRPPAGYARDLWREVKQNLPPTTPGTKYGLPHERLHFYVSLNTRLDLHHGVDAFFWWKGAYVTLDVSLLQKCKGGRDRFRLKADYVLTPQNCTEYGLACLGKQVAVLLMERLEREELFTKNTFGNRLQIKKVKHPS